MAVTIFHTPGCGRCQAAEEFFRRHGLMVEMVNVAGDRAALKRMARLAPGHRAVPVIQFEQEVFLNFEPEYWSSRLGAGR